MKFLISDIFSFILAVYFTSLLFSGLRISGGLESYIIGGVILTVASYIIKPILTIITLPLGIITLGFFSIVVNSLVVFFATLVFPRLSIHPFSFPGFTVFGFSLPSFSTNILLSYLIISATIYFIVKFVKWIYS